jgi:hypothetical protein
MHNVRMKGFMRELRGDEAVMMNGIDEQAMARC